MIPIANPVMEAEEIDGVRSILESGMIADGPEVRSFEDEFADYCGADHAVATSNGTTALHAAFKGLGIGHGDRVLTTPFSFVASANAIRLAGADPVFADIDPQTYNLDPASVRDILEDEPVDAILVVHLYGLAADMAKFRSIADEHDVLLVEDAAQAHGAEFDGNRVGSFGDAACFSFYPTKNMTTGEGGMITTDDEAVADRAARFINHGRTDRYEHAEVGHNFRMTSIAAAIGRAQLDKLPEYISQRRDNADQLSAGLQETPVTVPTEPSDRRHVYHQYTIRAPDREQLIEQLDAADIGTGVYYPMCIHQQPAYAGVSATVPQAEQAAESVVSLPVHPMVSAEEIDTIITEIRRFYTDD